MSRQKVDSPVGKIDIQVGVDNQKHRYFKFTVGDGHQQRNVFSLGEIMRDPTALYTALANAGAKTIQPANQRGLLKAIEEAQTSEPTFHVANSLGWHRNVFVLPQRVFGKSKTDIEQSFGELDPRMLSKYRSRGTLEKWQQKIGNLCRGNSRLMFAVSLAVSGPILKFVDGPHSGGFQFRGPGESGKTTGAIAGGSVWGCHVDHARAEKGFAESWNTTANNVEKTALAHNHTLLILDETKSAGETERDIGGCVLTVAFKLSEVVEKGRLTSKSSRGWSFYFLSTSNYSLHELGGNARRTITDAERGRLVEIPCPAKGKGIFEELHGFEDGAALANVLQKRCRLFFGTPGRTFVRKLVEQVQADRGAARKVLRKHRRRYLKAINKRAEKLGLTPLNRASDRFATVYAAGCLAISYGIFPWTETEHLKAVLSCQVDGLQLLASTPEDNVDRCSDLKKRLVEFIRQNQNSFVDLRKKRPKHAQHVFGEAAGYTDDFKGETWFYLPFEVLSDLLAGKKNAVRLAKALHAAGLLAKSAKRWVTQRPIHRDSKRRPWVIALRTSILGEQA